SIEAPNREVTRHKQPGTERLERKLTGTNQVLCAVQVTEQVDQRGDLKRHQLLVGDTRLLEAEHGRPQLQQPLGHQELVQPFTLSLTNPSVNVRTVVITWLRVVRVGNVERGQVAQ